MSALCIDLSLSLYLQSLQAAIEGYSLGLLPSQEAVIGPLPGSGGPLNYMTWASAFPTAAYDTNQFYTGGLSCNASLLSTRLTTGLYGYCRGVGCDD